MPELLIGCGADRTKKLARNGEHDWKDVITLDINPDAKPDVIHDLTKLPLPFSDNTFDECHAYDVLEHTGQQGDWRFFFEQWSEFWRIMKPGGYFMGISPHWNDPWTWGDPGHTRVISEECLTFLSQENYAKQVGVTSMTDYRFIYKADFSLVYKESAPDGRFRFVLEAIKPSRLSPLLNGA